MIQGFPETPFSLTNFKNYFQKNKITHNCFVL